MISPGIQGVSDFLYERYCEVWVKKMTKKIYSWALVTILSLFIGFQVSAMKPFVGLSELARPKPTDEKREQMTAARALLKKQGVTPGASVGFKIYEKLERMKKARALLKKQGITPGASVGFKIYWNAAECKSDEFFISQQGSDLGICVSPNVLGLSKMLKNMIADIVPERQMLKDMPGELLSAEHKIIPLDLPLDVIKKSFGILQNVSDKQRKRASQADVNAAIEKTIKSYTVRELVAVANAINSLDCPLYVQDVLLDRIKKDVEVAEVRVKNIDGFTKLRTDLQRLLLVPFCNDTLKRLIIDKYALSRKKFLRGHQYDVIAVAFSPDGTKIVSGFLGAQNNLILWDSEGNQITVLQGHQAPVTTVAFSPDGKRIVSGSSGAQKNLILWDSEGNLIKVLHGHPSNVKTVASSPDGSKIVSGSSGAQKNLILWDLINNQEQLAFNELKNCSLEQLILVYQLCLDTVKNKIISLQEDDKKIFQDLPQQLQQLLNNVLLPQGLISQAWDALYKIRDFLVR